MITNIDHFTVEKNDETDEIEMKLMDLFGNGEVYGFKPQQAVRIWYALTRAIFGRHPADVLVATGKWPRVEQK